MATYVNDLRLKEIATGDESGTWGTSTNTNLELIAEAFSFGTEAITTNADTHTTTIADGSTDPGRSIFLKYTGTLDSACTITIGPNTVSKFWFIENATSGSQTIIIKQGSGATITVPNGQTKAIYSDGAGSGAAMVDAFASLNVVDLSVEDDLTVTDDVTIGGTLGVTGVLTATSLDISGDIDVDGTTNLDVVDIDGALTQDGGAVFNEASADVDFRVESNGNANMLFVDGGEDHVNIGTTSDFGDTFNVSGTGHFSSNVTLSRQSNDTGSTGLAFEKTRSTSVNGNTVVQNGDQLGFVAFRGNDGDQFIDGAYVISFVDGTPGNNDMPTSLQFWTTADGASSPTARMVINNKGSVGIGVADGDVTNDGTAARTYVGIIGTANRGRLNIGSTASNGADAGTLSFTNGANSLADLTVDTTSGVQNTGTLFVNGTRSIKIQAAASDEVVFNESGADVDFRVESNGNANMIFVDAANDYVSIATTDDYGKNLNVSGGLEVRGTGDSIELQQSSSGSATYYAMDNTVETGGKRYRFGYSGGTADKGSFSFYNQTDDLLNLVLSDDANVFNEDSKDVDFRVESNDLTHMLFVDAGNNALGIGRIPSSVMVDVQSTSSGTVTVLRLRNSGQVANSAVKQVFSLNRDGSDVDFEAAAITVGKEQNWTTTGSTIDSYMAFNTVLNETSTERLKIDSNGTIFGGNYFFQVDTDTGILRSSTDEVSIRAGGNDRWVVTTSGVSTSGSLSKGSGSFKIDHPLPAKTDTHHLVHSFVEAPQADNIYRGSVDLVGGSATVNIDTAAGMTDGTFVLLNTNVQCFTSNESGWTAIKGSVSGNTLTITAQDNSCTDTISWMVVGERHDQHMKDTDWTDSDGKVIVEPEKT